MDTRVACLPAIVILAACGEPASDADRALEESDTASLERSTALGGPAPRAMPPLGVLEATRLLAAVSHLSSVPLLPPAYEDGGIAPLLPAGWEGCAEVPFVDEPEWIPEPSARDGYWGYVVLFDGCGVGRDEIVYGDLVYTLPALRPLDEETPPAEVVDNAIKALSLRPYSMDVDFELRLETSRHTQIAARGHLRGPAENTEVVYDAHARQLPLDLAGFSTEVGLTEASYRGARFPREPGVQSAGSVVGVHRRGDLQTPFELLLAGIEQEPFEAFPAAGTAADGLDGHAFELRFTPDSPVTGVVLYSRGVGDTVPLRPPKF